MTVGSPESGSGFGLTFAVGTSWFHYASGALVLANFVVMCLYRPGDSSVRAKVLHILELSFAGIFVGEILLRMIASGQSTLHLDLQCQWLDS